VARKVGVMGVLNEAAIERAVKKNGERLDALLAEQRQTNALLTQLIQVMQAGMTVNERRAVQGLPAAVLPAGSAGVTRAEVEELKAGIMAMAPKTLTSSDPEPVPGTVVLDATGCRWFRAEGMWPGSWLRSGDGDPETWTKVAGNYGPVQIVSSPVNYDRASR
jgi:hypothetical protein